MEDTAKNNERKSENKINQRKRIIEYLGSADFWTAIATIFLVAVGIWGVVETKHSLMLSERAWISPINANLVAPIEEGKVIRFQVVFINSGKEPAINIAYSSQNGVIKAPPYEDWSSLAVDKNTTCDGLRTIIGSGAMAPSTGNIINGRGFDSGSGKDPITASKSIIDGIFHYYIRGCIAYTTFEEPHFSSFCYVLQTRFGIEWKQLVFRPCNIGFESD